MRDDKKLQCSEQQQDVLESTIQPKRERAKGGGRNGRNITRIGTIDHTTEVRAILLYRATAGHVFSKLRSTSHCQATPEAVACAIIVMTCGWARDKH